jgi:hypothetical protein
MSIALFYILVNTEFNTLYWMFQINHLFSDSLNNLVSEFVSFSFYNVLLYLAVLYLSYKKCVFKYRIF